MPIPLDLLRGVLGVLCIFFGHFLGRSLALARQGKLRKSKAYSWAIRMTVTVLAIPLRRGLDVTAIVIFALAALALAAGLWAELRPKQLEDLTKQIFPEDC